MRTSNDYIWYTVFQQNNSSDQKPLDCVNVYIVEFDEAEGTSWGNNNINVSSIFLHGYKGDLKWKFTSLFYHEMTHMFQWDGEGHAPLMLVEGVADYTKLKAGYAQEGFAKPGQGDSWDQGYDFTARFLEYCDEIVPGFVAKLNKMMRFNFDVNYFEDLTGKPVDQLWIEYKAKEEFCLISGLKFGVKNSTDYNKAKDPISFRRRVFSSDLYGRPIRGNDVLLLIESDVFKRLDDNDAFSLCCVGILQLVLLGVEDRRHVPNWILRLANDRVSWDNYPWAYVWPTLYKHLRDANVKRWQPLYASEPANVTDTKSYSIEGFAWAFKTWILESFRAATNDYYTRYRRHPRIVAWSSKHKFYRNMLKPMLHGQLPVQRLVPDETEARSRWWVSSRAYFDGRSFEEKQIPQKGVSADEGKNADMYGKMTRFMEDMRRVPKANTIPIIADQHFGVSDISGF
nr:hypothetical protein [Tanacetum cinerariifolium]